MNERLKERPTWSHVSTDVLPPIRLKHPLKQPTHQQPQQLDGNVDSSLCGHHGHKPMPCRLPPLDQFTSQTVQDADGINNNTSEVSFDLHYGLEAECDDTIAEHERPKAPEPMILESLSNYDLSELLGKDEEPENTPVAPSETFNGNHKNLVCATSTSTSDLTCRKKNSSNMDYLVLEDIDDSDYIDSQLQVSRTGSKAQAMSKELLVDKCDYSYLGSAKAATTVSEKSIKSTKSSSRSQSSRLRRLANNITRVMSNKFRKFCRPTRAEESSRVDNKNPEDREGIVNSSTSTQHLLS